MSDYIVGLTGGIGSGKSSVSDIFESLNITIIDADKVVHELLDTDTAIKQAISEKFGEDYIPNGKVNRHKIKERVFVNKDEKEWLEKCIHPRVREIIHQRVYTAKSPYCIVCIPLLIETKKMLPLMKKVIVVDCDTSTQIKRVQSRNPELSSDTIRAIINSQVSRETRLSHADYVIDNASEKTLNNLELDIKSLHQVLLKETN